MAFNGHTAQHDSQPVHKHALPTSTFFSSDSSTSFGQIRSHAWQFVHSLSLITGMNIGLTSVKSLPLDRAEQRIHRI